MDVELLRDTSVRFAKPFTYRIKPLFNSKIRDKKQKMEK